MKTLRLAVLWALAVPGMALASACKPIYCVLTSRSFTQTLHRGDYVLF